MAQLLIGSVNATNGTRFVKRSDELFIYAVMTNAIDHLVEPVMDACVRRVDV